MSRSKNPETRRIAIKQRILTGIIVLPLLVFFLMRTNQFWLTVLLGLVNLLALHEYFRLALPSKRRIEQILGTLAGTALLPILILAGSQALISAVTCVVLFWSCWFLFRYQDLATAVHDLALLLFGYVYLPLLLGHVGLLFQLPEGRSWIFLVLMAVMASDTAAYFVGSAIGKRRLYPAISPKKSWEGTFGGVAGSLLAMIIAKVSFFPALSLLDVVAVAVLLNVSGQLGDLFESMLKRSFGVKDSGNLIPGHGGILDRLDSLLFAFPVAYLYAKLIWS